MSFSLVSPWRIPQKSALITYFIRVLWVVRISICSFWEAHASPPKRGCKFLRVFLSQRLNWLSTISIQLTLLNVDSCTFWSALTIDSTKKITPVQSTKYRDSNSSVQFEFVRRESEKCEFLDFEDFGVVAIAVETEKQKRACQNSQKWPVYLLYMHAHAGLQQTHDDAGDKNIYI